MEPKVLLVWEDRISKDKDRRGGTRVGSGYGLYNGRGAIELLSKENGHDPLFDRYNDRVSKADKLLGIIDHIQPDVVYIARPVSYDTLTDVILKTKKNGEKILFAVTPEIYEKQIGRLRRKIKVNGSFFPLYNLKKNNHTRTYLLFKRLFDISFSLLVLFLTFPIFILAPILIKLTSHGPVFYTQVRAGLNGYPFKMYKFRSMVHSADDSISQCINLDRFQEPVYKLKNDHRVTWLGRLLRKTSIDELPQIFNVIKGDMSLVGPRPEDSRLVERYNAYFKERLRVKPGITGLQQINCRGIPDMIERMKHDLYYIENHTLWMDIKIMFRSIFVVLFQKGAW